MTLDRGLEQQQWPQGPRASGCVDPPHDGPRPQRRRRPEGALSTAAVFCTNK